MLDSVNSPSSGHKCQLIRRLETVHRLHSQTPRSTHFFSPLSLSSLQLPSSAAVLFFCFIPPLPSNINFSLQLRSSLFSVTISASSLRDNSPRKLWMPHLPF
ncbi:unnamed protein product [Protopolystoma xenopodis]|uniref:Uncharacterized protein n=1 Tax=Protopolystoma xenopodis TaxID=117903 RepID=A0A3S5C9F1_9PLAT|nr:unnamed protein product [Protopolystoma xenopodis]